MFQPCPTYNNINTKEWYSGLDRPNKQRRMDKLADEGYDGAVKNPEDPEEVHQKQTQAFLKSMEGPDRLPLGVFYKVTLPTLGDKLSPAIPGYAQSPPARQKIVADGGKAGFDVTAIMDESSVNVDAGLEFPRFAAFEFPTPIYPLTFTSAVRVWGF